MASFSVDITSVRFAATNTGYKDITISAMPQAGVNCSITGTDSSYFGFRIPGSDPNIYRVYTTSNTNIGTSSNARTATFKITNAGDSTDYVEVSLEQVPYYGHPGVRGVGNVYDNIYAYYMGDSFGSANIYAEYRSETSGTYAILYVDGYEGTTTLSESWAYYTADSTYTDTGFKQIRVGATNNYDTDSHIRRCDITFSSSGNSSSLLQNPYPSNTSGCTSPTTFSGSGSTERVTLKHTSENVGNLTAYIHSNDGLRDSWSYTKTQGTNYITYWDITLQANTDNYRKSGVVYIQRDATHTIYGFTIIRQDPGSGPLPTLTVDPSVLTYTSAGGSRVLDVTYAAPLSTNENLRPSWIGISSVSVDVSNREYTITAASNDTSVARNWDFELTDSTMSVTVPITQAAGAAASLSISPTSSSVSADSGSVQITVSSTGISEISYNVPGWVSYASKAGNVYTFNYTANTGSSQRTGTITFYGGGLSATYTLIQAAGASPSLTVSPTADSVSSNSGTYQVTVTATNIDTVTYNISDNWISYSSKVGDVYTFSYTANTSGSQRQGVVTFVGGGLSRTFTLTQSASSYVELTATPDELTYTTSGGEKTVVLTYTGVLDLDTDHTPGWVSDIQYRPSGNNRMTYYITTSQNTSQYGRMWNAVFSDDNSSLTVPVIQAGTSPATLTVSPSTGSVDANSGSFNIPVTTTGIDPSDVSYVISSGGSWLSYTSRSGSVFYFNYTANTGSSQRTAVITFSALGLSATYTLTQQVQSVTPTLTITPSSKTVSGAAGSVDITVEQSGIDNLQYSGNNFVFSHITGNVYTFSYGPNTSTLQSKTSSLVFTGGGLTRSFTLTQQPQSTTASLVVTPEGETVGSENGYVYVTVSYNRISYSSITYTIDAGWLSYVSAAGSVFKFAYIPNTTSETRTATVTFSGGGLSDTYVLIQQPGATPVVQGSIKAHPSKLRFYKGGGSKEVSFSNRPTEGLNYTITYTDGSGWLEVNGTTVKSRTVVASANDSGVRRRANIRFYDSEDSSNYVDVPVIQGGDGYDSIWRDNLYRPQGRDENNNYYYRVVNEDSGQEYFRGVSVIPGGWGGNIGGIDIPRLVDNYLFSHFMFEFDSHSGDWADMYEGYFTIDVYNMNEGYPGVLDATYKYWNDWSRVERRYDYTRTLNDPINGKGREDMILPFCVYYDDEATFNIVETDVNGSVNTYTFDAPDAPFVMRYDQFYDTKTLVYRQDDQILFTYDMTHCGDGALLYRNRFGGWDSFLIEGNISKVDNYTKQNYRRKGEYNLNYSLNIGYFMDEKRTDDVNIDVTYEAYTGWLTDEESERFVYHLLSSPTVYFQDFTKVDSNYDRDLVWDLIPVRLTVVSAEYKKFKNGKKLVNYLITFEKANTEKVKN